MEAKQIFNLGAQYIEEESRFGTGISDSFPSKEEFSLSNLLEVREEVLETFEFDKLENFDLKKQIQDYFKENDVEFNEDNYKVFYNGIRSWIVPRIYEEYIDFFESFVNNKK